VNDGWRVALATLAFERGAGLLGDILQFHQQLEQVMETARKNGRSSDPVIRQRLARAWARLYILRLNVLRSLTGIEGPVASPQASIAKLFWANWHRDLGELAIDVEGTEATVSGLRAEAGSDVPEGSAAPYPVTESQRIFLFTRAETIYGGSNEIQRNIIGERVLGLPPEPKVADR